MILHISILFTISFIEYYKNDKKIVQIFKSLFNLFYIFNFFLKIHNTRNIDKKFICRINLLSFKSKYFLYISFYS